MKLFKKAILAVVTFVLALIAIVAPVKQTNVEAANFSTGTVIYLTPNSNWKTDNARFAVYFFNNSTNTNEWASMSKVAGETDLYKVVAPSGTWSNFIFCRMNPSATANNWNNKWNQSGDLTYTSGKNWGKINDGQWDCGTNITWSNYTPKYTVTVYGFNGVKQETLTIEEGKTPTLTAKNVEGYNFAGWYTDSSFNTPYVAGAVKSNLNIYAKYEEIAKYTVNVYGLNNELLSSKEVYEGTLIETPEVVEVEGYNFIGWYTDAEFTQEFEAVEVTANLDFYAKYEEIYVGPLAPVEGIGYQVGTKDESKALRIVVQLDLTAEDLETFEDSIVIEVVKEGHAGVLTHNVETLYSTVNPMNGEEVLTDAYFAVLTITRIPAGNYTINVYVGEVLCHYVAAVVA